MQYIALDAHKRYSLVSVEHPAGGVIREARLEHGRGAVQKFLAALITGPCNDSWTLAAVQAFVDDVRARGVDALPTDEVAILQLFGINPASIIPIILGTDISSAPTNLSDLISLGLQNAQIIADLYR